MLSIWPMCNVSIWAVSPAEVASCKKKEWQEVYEGHAGQDVEGYIQNYCTWMCFESQENHEILQVG